MRVSALYTRGSGDWLLKRERYLDVRRDAGHHIADVVAVVVVVVVAAVAAVAAVRCLQQTFVTTD